MLYLVSTPIGNLGDITLRALQVLKEVDLVVSEDTRKTGHLLSHFEIKKPQYSFHTYNEHKVVKRVIQLLKDGSRIALVTNAGTPAISDPGYLLVRACIDEDLPLTFIPGPTALIGALVISGLPAHSFTFRGFPPRKSGPRKRFLEVDKDSPHTLIFYESPYRLVAFLEDALSVFGNRQAVVANDLTKMFESFQRGYLSDLIGQLSTQKIRGEYSVVIAGVQGISGLGAEEE
jgi:16S rRNA (cytidine1402-2'-O)-methyltransferase